MTTYLVRLPWTTPPISLNDRGHWRTKAARVKYVRYQVAQLLTLHRMRPARRIHVTLHYVPRDRRRRDADNLVGTLKPCIDAMVDAGLVRDDSPEYVTCICASRRTTDMAKPKRSGRYGKLYADLLTDPKLAVLMSGRNGHRALAVHALALAWCALHLTDGEIPRSVLPTLHGKPADADALVDAGLWEPTGNGWRIAKYADANLTKQDVAIRALEGQISRCAGWMKQGRTCSCGHHAPTGDVIGNPVGDLVAGLVGDL